MQEVNKMDLPRPYFSHIIFISDWIFQEDIQAFPRFHSIIIMHRHPSINQGHKMHLVLLHHPIQHTSSMCMLIDCKYHLSVHVVQVRPNSVNRQIMLLKLL